MKHTEQKLDTANNSTGKEIRIILRTPDGYFGKGPTLEDATKNIRKAGARGRATGRIYIGSVDQLRISIIDGSMTYPSAIESYSLGVVKL